MVSMTVRSIIYTFEIFSQANEIILRIRDDCKPFNPLERYSMIVKDDENPTQNVGIRMLMKLSSSVQYLSTFSTNNLIIHIADKPAVV